MGLLCVGVIKAMMLPAVLLTTLSAGLLASCSSDNKNSEFANQGELLYSIGDSSLSVASVVAQIPPGLDPQDSIALFRAIADDWLFSMLLENEAQLDYGMREKIESQVRQYRRRLLAARYRESLAAGADPAVIPEDSVKAVYNSRRSDYVLQAPMVKGILLQMPANASGLAEVRTWMNNPTMANIDWLEKVALPNALSYEYFYDDWQDWRDIAALIPYRFPEGDAYAASLPKLETQHGNSVYLLTITDYLPVGAMMPYEKAAPLIRAEMMRRREGESDRTILNSLRNKALKNGTLKVYSDTEKQHTRR